MKRLDENFSPLFFKKTITGTRTLKLRVKVVMCCHVRPFASILDKIWSSLMSYDFKDLDSKKKNDY